MPLHLQPAPVQPLNEHKQANERETGLLRELRTLFENFPLGILYLDNKYNVIAMNNFLTELTGLREEELKGRPCYETLGEYADDPAKKGHEQICSFCKKDECFKNKRPTVIERPFKNKFVRVTTVPELDENGDVSRFLEIVEDITDRKLAEAEAIRSSHLASLGELAAGVAHEVNNPINGIINYAQMLQNKYAPDSRDYTIANRIIKESDRISGIVRKLLSFARDRKEEKSLTDISAVLSDALDLGGAQMKNDGIILNVNMQEALPEINANPQQIEQVFLNILSNARYALSQKYPGTHKDKALEITGEKVMVDERCYARITFYDRGTGISSGIIDKVMNPFFSTKPGNQGTGLGLSISHGIISDHGGKVMIDSVEGEYTKIIVDLPVAKQ